VLCIISRTCSEHSFQISKQYWLLHLNPAQAFEMFAPVPVTDRSTIPTCKQRAAYHENISQMHAVCFTCALARTYCLAAQFWLRTLK
jgi:hypothetical protein